MSRWVDLGNARADRIMAGDTRVPDGFCALCIQEDENGRIRAWGKKMGVIERFMDWTEEITRRYL